MVKKIPKAMIEFKAHRIMENAESFECNLNSWPTGPSSQAGGSVWRLTEQRRKPFIDMM